jgi:hypothetical protein
MRTYYRGHDAVVTSELFVRRATSAKTYVIRDMRDVCIVRQPGNGGSKALSTTLIAALIVGAAVAAWAAGAWPVLLLIGVASPAVVGGTLLGQRNSERWDLQATYRGQPVTLYSSADVRVFNQVTRALRRAIEADRRPPTWEGATPPDYAA